jgi:hypothetical protein
MAMRTKVGPYPFRLRGGLLLLALGVVSSAWL